MPSVAFRDCEQSKNDRDGVPYRMAASDNKLSAWIPTEQSMKNPGELTRVVGLQEEFVTQVSQKNTPNCYAVLYFEALSGYF
jgi:hypothetical protein